MRPGSAVPRATGQQSEPVWHPPRPRTASFKPSTSFAQSIQELKDRVSQSSTNHLSSLETSPGTADEIAALATRQLERVYLNRRAASRPSSASVLRPASAAVDEEPFDVSTRPASASSVVRGAMFSEIPNDVRVLTLLESQLRGPVDLASLREKMETELDTDAAAQTPLDRYAHYKRCVDKAIPSQQFPSVAKLVQAIFDECDRVIEASRRHMSVSNVEVSTCAMRTAIHDASAAARVAEEAQQRVDDLEQAVSGLTRVNVQFARNQDVLEEFIAELRAAIATTHSACVLSSDVASPGHAMQRRASLTTCDGGPMSVTHRAMSRRSSLRGLHTPTATALDPLDLQQVNGAVAPDQNNSKVLVDALRRVQLEFEQVRAENVRLAELATGAMDQHIKQSAEMADLLDRANGFQIHVGNLKTTMRVMKTYIEKLEDRVLVLTAAHDTALLADVRAGQFACDAADAESTLQLCDAAHFHALLPKPGAVDHLKQYYPAGGLAADQIEPAVLVKRALDEFTSDRLQRSLVAASSGTLREQCGATDAELAPLPAHLQQISIPKLAMRPFEGLAGINAFISDVTGRYVAHLGAAAPGHATPFDAFLWEECIRRAPAGAVKGAAEIAISAHYMATRYDRQSLLCHLYRRTSTREVPSDLWLHYPRHVSALRERLRQCEPASKRARDKISRQAFLGAVKDVFPDVTDEELTVLSSATITAAALDSIKVTEEVSYEGFFDKATSGATLVHDAIVRIIAACCVRFIIHVKGRCLSEMESEVKKRAARVARERAASRSAEVRRMMALDASEVGGPTGIMTLGEVVVAATAADPSLRTQDLKRFTACAAASPYFYANSHHTHSYAEKLDCTRVHVDVLERRLRTMGFHVVTTPFSPPDYPEIITQGSAASGADETSP